MRTSFSSGVLFAVLAAAVLAPGCRTMNRSRDRVTADQIPFETVNQPSRIARTTTSSVESPEADKPVAAVPVVDPVDVRVPEVDEPAVETPVAQTPVVVPPPKAVMAKPAVVEPVTAKRADMDTTPYEVKVVKSADEVGKPGSYVERVIPENGGDQPFAVELDGLSGSTGRHVPAPAPEPEPVPVVKPAPADSGWYIVQAGDILGRIAAKHGVSRQAILDANPSIKDPNKLRIGQKIKIPPRGTGIADKPRVKKSASAAPKAKKSLPAKDGFIVYTVKKGDILDPRGPAALRSGPRRQGRGRRGVRAEARRKEGQGRQDGEGHRRPHPCRRVARGHPQKPRHLAPRHERTARSAAVPPRLQGVHMGRNAPCVPLRPRGRASPLRRVVGG